MYKKEFYLALTHVLVRVKHALNFLLKKRYLESEKKKGHVEQNSFRDFFFGSFSVESKAKVIVSRASGIISTSVIST